MELLPNPPASLDAAGAAGVINIRTKRSTRRGLTGTATATAGKSRYERASANPAYSAGRVPSFARAGAGYSNSYKQLSITRLMRDTTFARQHYWLLFPAA